MVKKCLLKYPYQIYLEKYGSLKKYQKVAGKLAYDRKMKASLGDPFQNVFTQIANDMLMTRENLANKNVQDLRNISELKFAEKFSPDAFSNYMTTNKKRHRKFNKSTLRE